MAVYSEKVMDHFMNPRNVGEIPDADGVGSVGNPVCGDMMTFYIKVDDDRLSDVKFKTFGCGAAIAVSSMVSEMAKGKTLEEAKKITNADVAEELDGLPKQKMHCSNLGADALHKAIGDYESKMKEGQMAREQVGRETEEKATCVCPFCDNVLEMPAPWCGVCEVEIRFCEACREPVPQEATACPNCGAECEG